MDNMLTEVLTEDGLWSNAVVHIVWLLVRTALERESGTDCGG